MTITLLHNLIDCIKDGFEMLSDTVNLVGVDYEHFREHFGKTINTKLCRNSHALRFPQVDM